MSNEMVRNTMSLLQVFVPKARFIQIVVGAHVEVGRLVLPHPAIMLTKCLE
jgi:hypothetical protein